MRVILKEVSVINKNLAVVTLNELALDKPQHKNLKSKKLYGATKY